MLSSYYGSAKIPQTRFHQIKANDIKPGEDLVGSIAQKYGVQASHILEANPGIQEAVSASEGEPAPDALIGQMLVINLQHSTTC